MGFIYLHVTVIITRGTSYYIHPDIFLTNNIFGDDEKRWNIR